MILFELLILINQNNVFNKRYRITIKTFHNNYLRSDKRYVAIKSVSSRIKSDMLHCIIMRNMKRKIDVLFHRYVYVESE